MKKYMLQNLYSNALVFTMVFGLSLLGVATAVILTFATNALLAGDFKTFITWSLINLLAWGLMLLLNYFTSVYQQKVIQKMSTQIRVDFATGLENIDYEAYHERSNGQYISWMTNDLKTIEDVGFRNVYAFAGSLFSITLSSIALFSYHYALLILTIVLAVIMFYLPDKFTHHVQKATLKLSKSNENLTNKIKGYLDGFDVLYFAQKRNKLRERFMQVSQDFGKEKVNYEKTNGKLNNGIGLLNILSQLLVDLATGLLVIAKSITFGAISTTGNLASTIFNSLAQLSGQRIQIKSSRAIFEKLNKVIDMEYSSENHDMSQNEYLEELVLDDISFSYDGKKVLDNFNMVIKKGCKYAIIGESGSGKSTLLKIIAGQIKDFKGHFSVNGIVNNGDLMQMAQYIDQNVYLFQDSFRNNITLWDNYADDLIESCMKKAHVNFLKDIDEIAEENGRNLSGGQRQRIALARSFIQNKKFLLIDEGTSSLDRKSAKFIEEALLKDPALTVVMVTHRLEPESLELFDEVIDLTPNNEFIPTA
ncbi:ABC transporter ATP-binding protein [Sporosarcina sp. Marseille-Q4943]|uniref:ATP-binding cassette domain-containing protein n=1 Tax=Sporosarcina sp. Marseille-Q4943 TaxID=2942204 RepID=UPI00208DC58D|nr:ABC transporter ATP-binding protein [Sporosarcina sp. Marseille-Q4943]